MVADVPLGAFLSGGVDSSAVVALMAEASREPVKTCSIGFDVAALDETGYAAEVARRFATDHRSAHRRRRRFRRDRHARRRLRRAVRRRLGAADLARLPAGARERHRGAVGRRRRRGVRGLSPLPAVHAHEERVRGAARRASAAACSARWAASIPSPTGRRGRCAPSRRFEALAEDSGGGLCPRASVSRPTGCARTLFAPSFAASFAAIAPSSRYVDTMREAPARDALDRAQYADLKYLAARRHPDQGRPHQHGGQPRGARAAARPSPGRVRRRLPPRMRVRGGQGKWLMKQAMRRYLPDDILYRPQEGLRRRRSRDWFRGPLAERGRRASRSGSALARTGWFDTARLRRARRRRTAAGAPTIAGCCGSC